MKLLNSFSLGLENVTLWKPVSPVSYDTFRAFTESLAYNNTSTEETPHERCIVASDVFHRIKEIFPIEKQRTHSTIADIGIIRIELPYGTVDFFNAKDLETYL